MSSNSIIESRRVPDPRSRLKNIIDQQARVLADSLASDDPIFMEQSITAASRLTHFDLNLDHIFNGDSSLVFYTPFEPDFSILTVHLYLENTGHYARDFALLGNKGIIGGNPSLEKGYDLAGLGGGFCLKFDGATGYVDVPIGLSNSNTTLNFSAYSVTNGSFSFCCFINPNAINLDRMGKRRTIAAKTDDASNSWLLGIDDTDGSILFHVKYLGTEYKVKAPQVVLAANPSAWYQVVAVFDASTTPKTARIYFNNISYTTVSTTTNSNFSYPDSTTRDFDLHIGRQNNNVTMVDGGFDPDGFDPDGFDTNNQIYFYVDGAFSGGIQDVRLYMKALSAAEINNLWVNKFSIYDIPLNQTALAGFMVTNT